LVVHEFLSRPDAELGFGGTDRAKVARNDVALDRFVKALNGDSFVRLEPGGLVGPLTVPGDGRVPGELPFLVGKAVRQLNQ
jgi:hypothetical protein